MIRRTFLATTATGIAVAAASPAPAAAAWQFDRAAFEAVLARPYRHRQVYATTQLAEGIVLHYMENVLEAYEHGFGEGPGTLHVAAVTYGTSLALALDDRAWSTYHIGAVLNGLPSQTVPDPLLAAATANPFGTRVDALVGRGASFFVCNNALHGFSGVLATKAGGTSQQAVHDDLVAHLRPGAMLVPAGVAALNACQEARFTLAQASIG
jgi:intracellular sulfur oxidation DsrE/DsrF family protein